MKEINIREVTGENWRETLDLTVRPEQQRFAADYAPIAAIALAKAYIRPSGAIWTPYAIYAGSTMVGFLALAYEPDTTDQYWLFTSSSTSVTRVAATGGRRSSASSLWSSGSTHSARCCNWWFTQRT